MLHKGCKRCHGDLYEEEFLDSVDLVCLQCGYRQSLTPAGRGQDLKMSRWFRPVRPSRAA
jgi:hypothetical protein